MQADQPSPGSIRAPWRAMLRRQHQRLLHLREQLRPREDGIHLLLAGIVGVLGGLVNIGFYYASQIAQQLAFGTQGEWTALAAAASPWLRLLLPLAGAFLAGCTLYWAAGVARLPDSGNFLEVVVVGDGRLHVRSALAKAFSSLLTISTGGSIGREGPIIHLSATLASRLGQTGRAQPYRLRLLVACGAAAGMAAAYNAPVTGAVFAAQIVLGSFSMSLFAPLVFASVVATMTSRSVFGIDPIYEVPADFQFLGMAQLPWFLLLGIAGGILGAGFLRLVRELSTWFERRIPHTIWRLTFGGLLVGLMAVSVPEIWGNGHGPTNAILLGNYPLRTLALLLLAKLAATAVTAGTGAVGGVFTPTLFLGAALGGVFGDVLHHFHVALDQPTAAFALVGMGCTLAATTHSPLLAMIAVFEISLNYTLMPPLMVACVVATLASRRFHRDDIYTEPLRRRGVLREREAVRLGLTTQQTVGDVMQQPVPPVAPQTPFRELSNRFLSSTLNHFPVVDASRRLIGIVALQDLKQYLGAQQDLESVIAFDVMRPPPPCLTPDQRVLDAVPILVASELRNVPVVNTLAEMQLVGTVNRTEALGLLAEAIDTGASRG